MPEMIDPLTSPVSHRRSEKFLEDKAADACRGVERVSAKRFGQGYKCLTCLKRNAAA